MVPLSGGLLVYCFVRRDLITSEIARHLKNQKVRGTY